MNLKKKMYLYANSIFLIEDFFHLPSESTTRVVHLELWISPWIFVKIQNGPNGIIRGLGETDSWKNQKQKSCDTVLLKVPSGQIGFAWEWYHWISLEKDINRYRFSIFYFWSWIFYKSSKNWAASCKNESNLLLVWITICMCSNHDLYCRTVLQKFSRDINCSLDYG